MSRRTLGRYPHFRAAEKLPDLVPARRRQPRVCGATAPCLRRTFVLASSPRTRPDPGRRFCGSLCCRSGPGAYAHGLALSPADPQVLPDVFTRHRKAVTDRKKPHPTGTSTLLGFPPLPGSPVYLVCHAHRHPRSVSPIRSDTSIAAGTSSPPNKKPRDSQSRGA